jgi:hypothetical protein
VSSQSGERTALLVTADLFFRAKIEAVLVRGGYRVARSGPAELAVVELGTPEALGRVRDLVQAGVRVIAFGSHVRVDLLREARAAGAEAVPNSEIESTVGRVVGR